MITVDIDTGGTMTDALITDGATRHCIKVDTTPHDYTVSFRACLEEAAGLYGDPDLAAFMRRVGLIRWTSTITTNVLAERRGVKVGLLVSKGHESDLYGDEPSFVVDELIPSDNVLGLEPEPQAGEILLAVKSLLERGVRRICVSLAGAFPDNAAEERIKAIIEDQYPDHLIGSVPVLLGSDMAPIAHDQTRAHYSLMNAYTHTALASSLFKAEDTLRDGEDWKGALLIGHTNGGVARVGKTKAVDTIESGPVFGTFGGAYIARDYGIANAVCFDVGGTTTKASVVKAGRPVMQRGGELMEVPVQTSFQLLRSVPLGGGSVARVRDTVPILGPDSMGAAPGPACYGLGGREATLTDALLVLGYLEPERFLGGRRALDREKAVAAIDKKVAQPLGISADQAALLIRDEAAGVMAGLVSRILDEAELSPEETSLFAYGGNGPLFGCFVADLAGMADVHIFDLGPVFSAFGSAQSNVLHVYERGLGCAWGEEGASEAARRLWRQAVRDLDGEGFDPAKAQYRFEAELSDGEGGMRMVSVSVPAAEEPDLAAIGAALKAADIPAGRALLLLRLESGFDLAAAGLAPREARKAAASGKRAIRFNGDGGQLPAHDWEALNAGDSIAGPAMVNGVTMTCPVPPGWSLALDKFGNGHLKMR